MLPNINQVISIQIASIDPEEENRHYKTRVADVKQDTLYIEVPLDERSGKWRRLHTGEQISVQFVDSDGIHYFFSTTVLGSTSDQVKLYKISKPQPADVSKSNRRNFLRVPAKLEVALKATDEIRFTCMTDDVSGGGIAVYCSNTYQLHSNQEVSGWILIPYKSGEIEHAHFQGEIVRTKPLENHIQLAMIQFTDMRDKERQKIIRYCFEFQLSNRKE
ncbi:flagellar brake protein [Marinicrinis lubricantis]|uniref:Flagellar brake protein n=1 Tax=Marinicrinis lubricantis TaxID=2086470 RepID=A0ABW1ISN0_9BACL